VSPAEALRHDRGTPRLPDDFPGHPEAHHDPSPDHPVAGRQAPPGEVHPSAFPAHSCYVEPFAGAAALFFLKEPSDTEVLNDINGELVNLYRVVRHHLEELVRQFKWALVSREMFKWLQDTPTETLTDVQRAARFYFLQKCAFGSRMVGQSFGTATTGGRG
jgi:hypothetical protein